MARWLAGFADRHGDPAVEVAADRVVLTAPDGSVAEVEVPLPPLPAGDPLSALVQHATRDRRLGLLLLRRGGAAVAVAMGAGVVTSKVGRRRFQGRTAAGGWSQQRYARRRANQTADVVALAADLAADILVPQASRLDAVAAGGDRLLLRALGDDQRLAPLWERPSLPLPHVSEPRQQVLFDAVRQARAVRILVRDPG